MRKSKRLRVQIKAAKRGHPAAMYRLGLCFEAGRGVEKNPKRAAGWIAAAAAAGYAPAIAWMTDY